MHKSLTDTTHVPWTIGYAMRKRAQIDSFNELPREKRPPENMIWEGSVEELDEWFDKVFDRKGDGKPGYTYLDIKEEDVQ